MACTVFHKLSDNRVSELFLHYGKIKQIISRDKQMPWSMNGDKSPGLDGFSAHFFTSAWSVVGQDVSTDVLDFFNTGKLVGK